MGRFGVIADHKIKTTAVSKKDVVNARIRILATSDLHMHLTAYDYFADKQVYHKGLSMTASLIHEARQNCTNTFLFDNGDFLQGSPLGDFMIKKKLACHPMIEAMNELGYDGVNIGNHEFSFGVDYLLDVLKKARFPYVCANAFKVSDGSHLFPKSLIVERKISDSAGQIHTIKLGVTGVLPPKTMTWEEQALSGCLTIGEMLSAVRENVADLKKNGVDLVIVLAHCGLDDLSPIHGVSSGAEKKAVESQTVLEIAQLPEVDVIIMGHEHRSFPGALYAPLCHMVDPKKGTLNGKPAVMPSAHGSHLGVIDLKIEKTSVGWKVKDQHVKLCPTYTRTPGGKLRPLVSSDERINKIAAPTHKALLEWVRKPIGRTSHALHSYFAMLPDNSALQVVQNAQLDYVKRKICNTVWEGVPVLSATAPFKAGGRNGPENYSFVSPGDIFIYNALDLYVQPNKVVALYVSGEQIHQWLECSARIFYQIDKGSKDHPLVNANLPIFQFDTISGLSYCIDLAGDGVSRPRIKDLSYNGAPVLRNDHFILATNSYRRSGAGGFLVARDARLVFAENTLNRDILISYLKKQKPYDPWHSAPKDQPISSGWHFAPSEGTSVIFESALQSTDYIGELKNLSIESIGVNDRGFQNYRLWL